jgi:hypothetical protein
LITAGIQGGMDGLAGLAAWRYVRVLQMSNVTDEIRWLFIIEGGITILAAGMSLFILPDYPHS